MIKDRINYMRLCNKIYFPNNPFQIEEGDIIHVATYFISDFVKNVKIDKPNITLISCGYDDMPDMCITQSKLSEILENPNLKEWLIENCNFKSHKKLKYVYCWINSEYILLNCKRLQKKEKKNEIFYSFSISSNPHERFYLPNTKTKNHEEYAEKMAEHKYVYIPASWSGFDMARVYEAVMCGCIPIVKVPKNFSKTYENFNYVCLPGTVVTKYSHEHVNKLIYETPYIPEKPIENSVERISFEQIPDYKMSREYAQRCFDALFSFGGEYVKKFDAKHHENSLEDFENLRR